MSHGRRPRERLAAERHPPAVRPQIAGDDVEGGGLARAVGADQARDRARAHRERHAGQRGDAAERDGEIGTSSATASRAPPRRVTSAGTMPRGRKKTSSDEQHAVGSICHCQDVASRSASGSTVKSSAPTTGPASVPLPPATTMMTIVTV